MEEKKPGEEEQKKEEKKEEKKSGGGEEAAKAEDNKEGKAEKSPPPPQDIILKVYMHCEGCARKVRRCLKGFEGVDDVNADYKSSKVVVKGEKADPLKVLERVQRKTHRQVELLSPIPKPPSEDDKKPDPEKEKPKPEDKKEEPPVVTVVLKVYMHCEACAQEIKKRILRMKGVESAEPDLKSSQVTVKGGVDPAKLVEYVYKRTGKHAVIVKQDPDNNNNAKKDKEEISKPKDEKKAEDGGAGGGGDKDAKKGSNKAAAAEDAEKKKGDDDNNNKNGGGGGEENKVVDVKKSEFNSYPPPRYAMELYASYPFQEGFYRPLEASYPSQEAFYRPQEASYPPQIFSDENPNACSVM